MPVATLQNRIKMLVRGVPGPPGDTSLPFPFIKMDTTTGEPATPVQGQFWWNQDEETIDLKQDGATLQLGQEVQWPVRNQTGSTILNGKMAMAIGTIGATGRILVGLNDGSVPANAKFVLGMATHDISSPGNGKVTAFGKVRDIDTSAWSDGDVLWIDPDTAGELTSTEPDIDEIGMPVGFVVNSHPTEGVISMRVTPIDEHLILTPDIRDALDGAASPSSSNVFATIVAWLSITAQGWTVIDLGTVSTILTMNAAVGSEFLATLPNTGTTTTISISNLQAVPSAWPVLHLITGATFDDPVWSGVDATGITLTADTTHNIGFQPVKTTSAWKVVAVLMHSEADA